MITLSVITLSSFLCIDVLHSLQARLGWVSLGLVRLGKVGLGDVWIGQVPLSYLSIG